MSDIWFIFNNNGEFLFKTTEINRTDLSLIPSQFNAKYIVKNPSGYNSAIVQDIRYDISTGTVIFSTKQIEEIQDEELLDYGEIVEDLTKAINDIEILEENLNTERLRINDLYNLLNVQQQIIDNNNIIINQQKNINDNQQIEINTLQTLYQTQKTDIETLSNLLLTNRTNIENLTEKQNTDTETLSSLILTNRTNIENLTEKQNTDTETLSSLILTNRTNIENLQILTTTQQQEINSNTNILTIEKNMLDIVLTNVEISTN